jgi:hypothetical protein
LANPSVDAAVHVGQVSGKELLSGGSCSVSLLLQSPSSMATVLLQSAS